MCMGISIAKLREFRKVTMNRYKFVKRVVEDFTGDQ